jgi:hypothetical protein
MHVSRLRTGSRTVFVSWRNNDQRDNKDAVIRPGQDKREKEAAQPERLERTVNLLTSRFAPLPYNTRAVVRITVARVFAYTAYRF